MRRATHARLTCNSACRASTRTVRLLGSCLVHCSSSDTCSITKGCKIMLRVLGEHQFAHETDVDQLPCQPMPAGP